MAEEQFPFPISDGAASSIYMHEQFCNHVAAGFTEDQALRLIAYTFGAIMANIIVNRPPDGQ